MEVVDRPAWSSGRTFAMLGPSGVQAPMGGDRGMDLTSLPGVSPDWAPNHPRRGTSPV
jgi:hypothetical protein